MMDRNFLSKLILSLMLISSAACLIVDKSQRNELEIIESSRRIIKSIEDCKWNSDANSREEDYTLVVRSEKDVVCERTTFFTITKLIENKLNDSNTTREAMTLAYEAIKEKNSFTDIASFIEKMINKPDGQSRSKKSKKWLTIVTEVSVDDTSLEHRMPEFLDFIIGNVRIKIFNLGPPSSANSEGNEHSNQIENILVSNPNLNLTKNLIHTAAALDLLNFVQFLIDEREMNPDEKDEINGMTPAAYASRNNSLNTLRYLISSKECDIFTRDNDGNGLLHHAAASPTGAVKVLRYLKKEKLDPNSRNNFGETPLHLIARSGTLNALKFFIESKPKPDINVKSNNGTSALFEAATRNRLEMVRYLVSKGALVQKIPETENNKEVSEIIDFELLKKEEKNNPFDLNRAIDKVMKENDLTLLKYIIQRKNVNVNRKFKKRNDQTFLHLAVENHRVNFLEYLSSKGIDLNLKNGDGANSILWSAKFGCTECVKFFTSKGLAANSKDNKKNSVIHYSVIGNQLETLKYLLEEEEVDPNLKNANGQTPLELARSLKHDQIFDYLNSLKYTNPFQTIDHNDTRALRFFITNKTVDVNLRDPIRADNTLLHEASKRNLEMVKFLVSKGADIMALNYPFRNLPFHDACLFGNEAVVKFYINDQKMDPVIKGYLEHTCLQFASDKNYLQIVKFLVEGTSIDPNLKSLDIKAALNIATRKGQKLIAEYLKSNLKKENENQNEQTKPDSDFKDVWKAIDKGDLKTITELIETKNLDPNYRHPSIDAAHNTLLHSASANNKVEIIKYLISKGANMFAENDYWKNLPIHETCIFNAPDALKFYLLEKRLDPNIRGFWNNTCLNYAAAGGHFEIVKFLLNSGLKVDISLKDSNGETAAVLARKKNFGYIAAYIESNYEFKDVWKLIEKGDLPKVTELIETKNLDPNFRDPSMDTGHQTLLHSASAKNKVEIIKYLISKGANMFAKSDYYENLPIHETCIFNAPDALKFYLFEKRFDPNIRGFWNNTCLNFAAENGHFEIVKLLLGNSELKIDLNQKDLNGDTAVDLARKKNFKDIAAYIESNSEFKDVWKLIEKGDLKAITELIEKKNLDPNYRNQSVDPAHNTLLHSASANNKVEIIKYLISKGANMFAENDYWKNLPIHETCIFNAPDALKFYLLEKRLDPNIRGSWNNTCLNFAAAGGHFEIVKFLLNSELKVDKNLKDSNGDTAVVLARKKNFEDIASYIESH